MLGHDIAYLCTTVTMSCASVQGAAAKGNSQTDSCYSTLPPAAWHGLLPITCCLILSSYHVYYVLC